MFNMKYIGGFLMALADSVPGVSGGTIAFLLGIYDDFINSINYLISGTKEQRKWAFFFLVKLGCGWIVGFVLAVLVLTSLFESNIYRVSSLFLGFIIFSIPLICSEEKETMKGHYLNLIFTAIGIAIVIAITIFNPAKSDSTDVMVFSIGNAFFVFLAGMIAISAMVLPGISGSTILLILGLYMPIMNSIKELLHLDFSALPIVACFGFGILAGALITFKVIKWALANYRSQTIYLVIGLMLGSLYSIIRGPETLDNPQPAMTFSTFSILFFVIGGVVIGGLQLLKHIKPEEKNN
ncbi:MAG: DUF368 domain-containing protein [Lachnospiraceae bacterium]|nr:DUF368 domain-containing protein [Lachnospiraceae bacterium]